MKTELLAQFSILFNNFIFDKRYDIILKVIVPVMPVIVDINNAKLLFEKLNFEELIKIHDHMLVYATDNDEIVIQSVNDKHLYIEIEDKGYYSGRAYNSIDEMKEVFTKYSIPIKGNNYFVKKAEIELYETYGNIENN